jgi:hypothetical protein
MQYLRPNLHAEETAKAKQHFLERLVRKVGHQSVEE